MVQGLLQCRNGRTGTVWSYISVSAGWLQFTALWPACNVYCCVRTANWHSSREELGLQRRNWLVLVSAYSYTLLRAAFFWRYIYVADVFDHNVHVMEKHANWNLTHVKVRCCCSIKEACVNFGRISPHECLRLQPDHVWSSGLAGSCCGFAEVPCAPLQSFRSSTLTPATREGSSGVL